MGSSRLPSSSFFQSTSGRETRTSWPSRRICSTRMAICISPRPLTSKIFGSLRLRDAQRDVGADFLDQPVPDVARGDELAVLAGERAVVHGEFHLNGRRINRDVTAAAARVRLSQIVSPMNTSSNPRGRRCRRRAPPGSRCASCPRNGRCAVILPLVFCRRRGRQMAGSPTLTLPSTILPNAIRPT